MYSGIVRTDSDPDIDEALRRVRAGAVTHLTDDERKELSDKVRESNRRSSKGSGR
ncbi:MULTISPECIES: hypothetical protein [Streptomyces]|uniref:hypothetical protein n=1 Tax=Streptomyces TaxID=1883 RepID=UPI002E145515|nr:hypothetical protein OG761_23310 [Streptomyces tubercidicus]